MNDWQNWAAPAVVLITVAIFLIRALKKNSKGGCKDCSCGSRDKSQ